MAAKRQHSGECDQEVDGDEHGKGQGGVEDSHGFDVRKARRRGYVVKQGKSHSDGGVSPRRGYVYLRRCRSDRNAASAAHRTLSRRTGGP